MAIVFFDADRGKSVLPNPGALGINSSVEFLGLRLADKPRSR